MKNKKTTMQEEWKASRTIEELYNPSCFCGFVEIVDHTKKSLGRVELVARVYGATKEQAIANTNIMAAAPDMAKAIEAIRDCTEYPIDIPPMLYNNLIAALNKVTKL